MPSLRLEVSSNGFWGLNNGTQCISIHRFPLTYLTLHLTCYNRVITHLCFLIFLGQTQRWLILPFRPLYVQTSISFSIWEHNFKPGDIHFNQNSFIVFQMGRVKAHKVGLGVKFRLTYLQGSRQTNKISLKCLWKLRESQSVTVPGK